jgi:hypothetical protein
MMIIKLSSFTLSLNTTYSYPVPAIQSRKKLVSSRRNENPTPFCAICRFYRIFHDAVAGAVAPWLLLKLLLLLGLDKAPVYRNDKQTEHLF